MASTTFTNQQILDLLYQIAPQFYTVDPVKLAGYNALIDALKCQVNTNVLGCCSLIAFANLLAHYLTMQLNPYLGVSNSISEGSLSISMSNTSAGNFYGSSPYGQAYLQLIGNYRVGAYVTNGWRNQYGPPCGC